jgi:ABC-type multidrug transport system ATPase subunit
MPAPDQPIKQPGPETVVHARGLSKFYRDFSVCALDELDLDIRRGEIFGLIGPGGSGKSTLLGILAGNLRPTYGTIQVCGASPPRAARQGRSGFVPDKTARHGQPRSRGIAGSLAGLFRRPPSASLAQVLARKPDIIILDNPFAGLDSTNRAATRELIQSMAGEGRSVVFSAHSLLEAKDFCHRVAIINAGKIEATGTIEEVLAAPLAVRILAPVISQESLRRALVLIRDDLGVPETRPRPVETKSSIPPRPKTRTPATTSSPDEFLSALVKESGVKK